MKSSIKKVENKFEHPIYCSSIISNNACFYEITKLVNQREIYFDFPYSKQLFFISHIDEIISEIPDQEEVRKFYEKNNKLQYFEDCRSRFNESKSNQNQWRKIKIDYYIEENGKKQYLSDFNVIRKDDILEHINKKKNSSQGYFESRSESQNDETDNSGENEVDIIDGIYYFSDFLDKSKSNDLSVQGSSMSSENKTNIEDQKLTKYIEKIFDQFNKSVIYSFLSYFLSSCILTLLNKKILIDIDIKNLILIRENSNIKFLYLVQFENFKTKLEDQLLAKKELKYKEFCDQLYFKQQQQKLELNEDAQKQIADFLKKISEALLNKNDLKEAQDDSEFAKECISGVKNIEKALSRQDIRKRYCKVLITKNQILTAILNSKKADKDTTFDIFLNLFKHEQENFNKTQVSDSSESLTQSEIINSFLQDFLKKACSIPAHILTNNQKNQEDKEDTLIEFCCEEYPRQSYAISIINQAQTQRERTKTPKFINVNNPDHEIAAITSQKRELQIQMKIKEFKINIEEIKKRKELDQLKNSEAKDQKTLEQIKKIEQMLHSAPSIRGGEKKLMIDFKESTCSLHIKLYYQQELFALPENIDEMLYCIQLLNNSFNDISIYMDEHKRICFETHVCMGQKEKILLRAIFMIDSLITYGITFYDFYYQSMINSKQSKDIQKYIQLQQEILQYLQAYKLKYDEFVFEFLNKNDQ